MQFKTILNRVQKFKSFVYTTVRWVEQASKTAFEVEIEPRANSRGLYSGCEQPRPGYDKLPARRFEFVPLWGMKVFFVYAPRQVDCRDCGVRVERLPWASSKHRLTDAYAWLLARWARRLRWKKVSDVFASFWDSVFRSVEMAVEWGRAHADYSGVRAIGIDEIAWQDGRINNVTFLEDAILIQLDGGPPTNCARANANYGWVMIPDDPCAEQPSQLGRQLVRRMDFGNTRSLSKVSPARSCMRCCLQLSLLEPQWILAARIRATSIRPLNP